MVYDYRFDWIIKKQRNKEISPEKEDYKKKLMERLEDKSKKRVIKGEEEDEG